MSNHNSNLNSKKHHNSWFLLTNNITAVRTVRDTVILEQWLALGLFTIAHCAKQKL